MIFMKGATAWEFQIGRFYGRFPFWSFVKVGCRPTFGWETDD